MAIQLGDIGLWTPPTIWDIEETVRREAVAELVELGCSAVWLGNASGDLNLVSELLSADKKVVVATGIVNVWTHDATELADAYQQVDRTYPGRALIGLGSSHAPLVEPTGQAYVKPFSKLRSYLDELDAAEPPMPPQARVLAALGPRTIELAGQRAAGAHPYLTTPEHTAWARELLGEGPLLAPEQKVVVESDPDKARTTAREVLAMYLSLPNYLNNLRRFGFGEDDVHDGGSDRLVDALVAWGDVDTIAGRLREHHDAGANHVAIQVLAGSVDEVLAQYRLLSPALTRS